MNNEIQNMDFESLMKKRQKTLDDTINHFDAASSSTKQSIEPPHGDAIVTNIETQNANFESLMKKRQKTLDDTINHFDAASSSTKQSIESSHNDDITIKQREISVDPSKLELAEVNYISNFYSGKSSDIIVKITCLKELLASRNFVSQKANNIITEKKKDIIDSYQEILKASGPSTIRLQSLKGSSFTTFIVVSIIAILCFLSGIGIIISIILLCVACFFYNKYEEYKDAIEETEEAKSCINEIDKIALIKSNEIVFLDSASRSEAIVHSPNAPLPPSTTPQTAETMYCGSCGKQIDKNAQFCGYCGHKV